jgi:5,10-methylenetetrahydrofolate reductase
MAFETMLGQDGFLVIAELEPPKGVDIAAFLANADSLRGRAHAVLVPEMSGAIMRLGSMGASALLKQKGTETVFTVNCRDKNRLALQADLLSSFVLGLENVLVVEGDHIGSGDHIEARAVNDLDVMGVLEAAKKLQKGIDLAGNEMTGAPRFCIGSEVNAGLKAGALEVAIMNMEKKIQAGVQFFITPTIYDPDVFAAFIKRVKLFNVPVFPRITLLNSVGMARFICKHMDGVLIPEAILDRLGRAPDKTKEGIAIAADTIKKYRGISRGVLLAAIGGQERMAAVLEQAGV